jgi:hypothetical protein
LQRLAQIRQKLFLWLLQNPVGVTNANRHFISQRLGRRRLQLRCNLRQGQLSTQHILICRSQSQVLLRKAIHDPLNLGALDFRFCPVCKGSQDADANDRLVLLLA